MTARVKFLFCVLEMAWIRRNWKKIILFYIEDKILIYLKFIFLHYSFQYFDWMIVCFFNRRFSILTGFRTNQTTQTMERIMLCCQLFTKLYMKIPCVNLFFQWTRSQWILRIDFILMKICKKKKIIEDLFLVYIGVSVPVDQWGRYWTDTILFTDFKNLLFLNVKKRN